MDILKVPTEIFLQIAEMISEEDVKALGQVSRGFRCQCEPLLYRSVTLSDRKKYSRRISTHILYRLKNVNDSMVHNVRHLSVGYASNASAVPERLLLQALQNMKRLESFSWCTWIPVSAAILECLQKVHPSSELKAIAHERNGLPFDIPLITSPQLHTLDIKLDILYPKIIPKSSQTGHRKCKGRSELNYLKGLIMEATNLKVFRIKIGEIKQGAKGAPSQLDHFGSAEYDPINFKFAKLGMITALEEFTLRTQFKNKITRTTAWKAWPDHQSWTSLRKLDLGITASEDMIRGLVGAVPRLTTLVVKVGDAFPRHETLIVYESFFQSVPELSNLSMRGTDGWPKAMLETIYGTVSVQLIYLDMDIGWDLSMWRRAQFKRLLGHCVKLERLILEGSNRLERMQAEWTADETKLSLKERLEHLRQDSTDRPRKMEYQHDFAKPHGQRSRGSHSLVRRWSIVSTRPYWLDRDDDSDG